jgi:hypothetical protein
MSIFKKAPFSQGKSEKVLKMLKLSGGRARPPSTVESNKC